jgi:hypothetical protein
MRIKAMSNWGDCSNRAYMEKMIEAAAKHPPNQSKKLAHHSL